MSLTQKCFCFPIPTPARSQTKNTVAEVFRLEFHSNFVLGFVVLKKSELSRTLAVERNELEVQQSSNYMDDIAISTTYYKD